MAHSSLACFHLLASSSKNRYEGWPAHAALSRHPSPTAGTMRFTPVVDIGRLSPVRS
jgi:hypothetical protein